MSEMDMEGMEERGKGDMGMETRGNKEKGMDMLNPGIPNFQERWVYTVQYTRASNVMYSSLQWFWPFCQDFAS